MKKEMIRIKGARENNLKNPAAENPALPLIQFMQTDREDIWNLYLLMQDSSWDRWRNRM